MSKRRKKWKPPAARRFKVGDRVRVKPGLWDEDHPDIPLGGWAGVVSQVGRNGLCCVRWSRETLANIHPICKKRCAIDGASLEEYWLDEADLESDPGGPLCIEQPTTIVPRPLSADEQGDRVRMVFGLTSDEFLPDADDDSLETYYNFLVEHMSLPMEARYRPPNLFRTSAPLRNVTVVALDRGRGWDEDAGILCEIRIAGEEHVEPLMNLEFRRSNSNRQLVDDFFAWFIGNLSEDDVDDDAEDDELSADDEDFEERGQVEIIPPHGYYRSVALMLAQIIVFTTAYGAIVGSALWAMQWAKWAACIAGGVWAVLVAAANTSFAQKDLPLIVPRYRRAFGCAMGLVTGAIQGVFFGVMAVAFLGAALGGTIGLLSRRLLGANRRFFRIFPDIVLSAAACGVAAQAFYLDRSAAMDGLWHGTLIGLAGGLLLCLVVVPLGLRLVVSPFPPSASIGSSSSER